LLGNVGGENCSRPAGHGRGRAVIVGDAESALRQGFFHSNE
jgi:hypothetical protein